MQLFPDKSFFITQNRRKQKTVDNMLLLNSWFCFLKTPTKTNNFLWSCCWLLMEAMFGKPWFSDQVALVSFMVCKFSSGWQASVHLILQMMPIKRIFINMCKQNLGLEFDKKKDAVMCCPALPLCRWSSREVGKSTSSDSDSNVEMQKASQQAT